MYFARRSMKLNYRQIESAQPLYPNPSAQLSWFRFRYAAETLRLDERREIK